jgi:hypothetical protein
MIQDTLVDYISSQMKSGVSRDAIKAALVGAGWAALDVEDTLKKVESPVMSSVQPAKPMGVSSAAAGSFFSGGGASLKSSEKNPEPQTIKVSDLVSASASASPSVSSGFPKESPVVKSTANPARMGTMGTIKPEKSGHGFVATWIFSIVIVILAGLSGYLFWQNNTLMGEIGSVNVQSQGVTGQVTSFQSQIQALDASNTALAGQVATLTAINQDLTTNLSLVTVLRTANSGTPTSTPITVSGSISGGKPVYVLTTGLGVAVSVKNYADAGVRVALQPWVGSSTVVQVAGTYIPGSSAITVTSVNGLPTTAPVAATSSVASSSATSTP